MRIESPKSLPADFVEAVGEAAGGFCCAFGRLGAGGVTLGGGADFFAVCLVLGWFSEGWDEGIALPLNAEGFAACFAEA